HPSTWRKTRELATWARWARTICGESRNCTRASVSSLGSRPPHLFFGAEAMLSATEPAAPPARRQDHSADGNPSRKVRPTVTLLLPVLNEIHGLRATLPFIQRHWVDEILVVDGGSTDGSVEYARDEDVRVIRQRRPGLECAVYDAIRELETD